MTTLIVFKVVKSNTYNLRHTLYFSYHIYYCFFPSLVDEFQGDRIFFLSYISKYL